MLKCFSPKYNKIAESEHTEENHETYNVFNNST